MSPRLEPQRKDMLPTLPLQCVITARAAAAPGSSEQHRGGGSGCGSAGGGSAGAARRHLFVVTHRGVSEDLLARAFAAIPGCEYCDLKHDHATGASRVRGRYLYLLIL